jgi:antitoxin MazE
VQVAKWGNSLAVRLPRAMVKKLGLKEGDAVTIVSADRKTLEIERDNKREEALKALRKYRGAMPKDFKFNRDEAHERD